MSGRHASVRGALLAASLLVGLGSCSSAPEVVPTAEVAAPTVERTRLVLQVVKAAAGREALAQQLEAEACSFAGHSPRHAVVCPADIRAASDALGSMSATGACEGAEADCEGKLQRLATGEVYLNVSFDVKPDDSAVIVVRLVATDGTVTAQVERKSLVVHELHKELEPAIRQLLGF